MRPAVIKVSLLEGNEIGRDPGLAGRLRDFLVQKHPHHTAKSVQQALAALGVEVGLDAIKKWLTGAWPSWPSHVEALLGAYGQDLVEAVFLPAVMSAEDLQLARIARDEAELAMRRERLLAHQHRRRLLAQAR
ncbi:hypothetical protein [Caulobacter sp. Root343]|uniref:hypothetical protein n=1 Tax=Caulobacter sp. Root343 TaxID=1736520 RepID=UPI0006F22EC1|nr:hypothetical protein [Caulobacter sp. Root343]KQV66612.1 hypothetical protein ASC70_12320 [Caulobacter sp. Root343]